MSAGQPPVLSEGISNTDDNAIIPLKLTMLKLPYSNIYIINNSYLLTDGMDILDGNYNQIDQVNSSIYSAFSHPHVEPRAEMQTDTRKLKYKDALLTIIGVDSGKLIIKIYRKDGIKMYSTPVYDKYEIHQYLTHEDKIYIVGIKSANGNDTYYSTVFDEKCGFSDNIVLDNAVHHYAILDNLPIFEVMGDYRISPQIYHHYDYEFNCVNSSAYSLHQYKVFQNRVFLYYTGRDPKWYELSYKPVNHDKMCIKCSKSRTEDTILSCGHRNYCTSCIENIKQCTICGKEVNIIHVK